MFEHYTFQELNDLWKQIHTKLKAPFPPGSVMFKGRENQKAYIPTRVYIHRLNEVAGPLWSWRITKERVNTDLDILEVNGVLKILHREIEGQGFCDLERNANTGRIYNYENAMRSASNDALRDACDILEMGWADLGPYRDWGKNPGVGLLSVTGSDKKESPAPNQRSCVRCHQILANEDEQLLKQVDVRVPYCKQHIPPHFLRKLESRNLF